MVWQQHLPRGGLVFWGFVVATTFSPTSEWSPGGHQEYAQTAVCACHSWKMVYPVLVLWLEADSSGFFLRRCSRAGMSVLELDGVSGDMLPRSDSFNGNGFASANDFAGP